MSGGWIQLLIWLINSNTAFNYWIEPYRYRIEYNPWFEYSSWSDWLNLGWVCAVPTYMCRVLPSQFVCVVFTLRLGHIKALFCHSEHCHFRSSILWDDTETSKPIQHQRLRFEKFMPFMVPYPNTRWRWAVFLTSSATMNSWTSRWTQGHITFMGPLPHSLVCYGSCEQRVRLQLFRLLGRVSPFNTLVGALCWGISVAIWSHYPTANPPRNWGR